MTKKLTNTRLKRMILEELDDIMGEDWIGAKSNFTPPLGTSEVEDEKNDKRYCPKCDVYHKNYETCPSDDYEIHAIISEECGCKAVHSNKMNDYSLDSMHDYTLLPKKQIKPVHHKKKESSYMAKKQLYNLVMQASKLYDELPDDLEDWMRSNIAIASDDIYEVFSSINTKKYS